MTSWGRRKYSELGSQMDWLGEVQAWFTNQYVHTSQIWVVTALQTHSEVVRGNFPNGQSFGFYTQLSILYRKQSGPRLGCLCVAANGLASWAGPGRGNTGRWGTRGSWMGIWEWAQSVKMFILHIRNINCLLHKFRKNSGENLPFFHPQSKFIWLIRMSHYAKITGWTLWSCTESTCCCVHLRPCWWRLWRNRLSCAWFIGLVHTFWKVSELGLSAVPPRNPSSSWNLAPWKRH